ncbi:MAG: alpha/beta fold hydrolase [Balneolaceae bacterium]
MSFILLLAGGFLALLLLMYLFQDRLLFMPSSKMVQTPDSFGISTEDFWIETEDGVQIHGWYFPQEDSDQVIVLSHGNAGNISQRITIAETLLETGAAVLMYDYRGYGKSEGSPSEKGLYKDIEAVVAGLKNGKGYAEENIFMYGRSLGGAVAAYAATQFSVGGLVLDSAFRNLKTMVRDVYPFVPTFLATYKFPTDQYLMELNNTPVIIMHSPNDGIVHFHNGEYLFDVANEPKQFVELRGGHNNNFFESSERIKESWRGVLESARKVKGESYKNL